MENMTITERHETKPVSNNSRNATMDMTTAALDNTIHYYSMEHTLHCKSKKPSTLDLCYIWQPETVFALDMLLRRLLLTSVAINIKLTSIFLRLFWLAESYTTVCYTQSLSMEIFWTQRFHKVVHLRGGSMFNKYFKLNLLTSTSMKEFWNSVSIWWSYAQQSSVLVF